MGSPELISYINIQSIPNFLIVCILIFQGYPPCLRSFSKVDSYNDRTHERKKGIYVVNVENLVSKPNIVGQNTCRAYPIKPVLAYESNDPPLLLVNLQGRRQKPISSDTFQEG